MATESSYDAVISILQATASVTELVGKRIYPRLAPQSALTRSDGGSLFESYIVVRRPAGEERTRKLSSRDTFRKTPMTVYCMADEHLKACRVADVVMQTLDSTSTSQTGSQSWGSYLIDHCEVIDCYDASMDPSLADEIGFPIEAIEINLYYNC